VLCLGQGQKPNNTEATCGADWVAYTDTKCFKVLEKKGTEDEAKANCSQVESSSTLITIGTKEEQTFLSNLLEKYNTVSESAWIGLEYSNKDIHCSNIPTTTVLPRIGRPIMKTTPKLNFIEPEVTMKNNTPNNNKYIAAIF
jgi:hypothetical protein